MVIGLTGGIGSGKSIVAKVFAAMGCIVYSSDDRARDMYFLDDVRQEVMKLLGPAAYTDPDTLNRSYISEKVFSDKTLLQQLNGIIHPAVKRDMTDFISRQAPSAIIVKETALLFETGLERDMDSSVLVVAPTELRVKRVMKRSNLNRAEVLDRINSQWTDELKISKAGFVIRNDEQNAVIPQVISILQQLKANT
ncbi:MAG: dephospho-CoA kinase [Bacteroidetes bacterium]|nr:dephospho-CoA kinase [Bacteroidota bacterium]